MARGYPGAFGGVKINSYEVWLSFCAIFLLGLIDWRRPLSVRNLDLLVLVSFSVSLWFFNHGHIFAAMSLAYPPLVWLLVRCFWIARRDRPSRGAPVWPVWVLVAATVFLAGLPRRPERPHLGRDRRRLLGRDRRRSHLARPEPVRALPDRGQPAEVRAGRLDRRGARPHPDERPLREREPARRHLRAGLVHRLPARLLDLRLERQVGLAAVRALHVAALRRARAARARRSSGAGSAGRDSGRRSRSRGSRGRSRSTRRTRTRTTRSCPRS